MQDEFKIISLNFNMNIGDSLLFIYIDFPDTGYTYCTDKKEVTTFIGKQGIQVDFFIDFSKNMADDEKIIRFQQGVGPIAYTLTTHDNPMTLKWAIINGILYGDTATSIHKNFDFLKIEKITLNQNYPNPINSSTKINFYLPRESIVTLKIYNLNGKEIETIIDKQRLIGGQEVIWDAKNISSGIYFYQLKTSDFFETKKLLFQK